MKKTVIIRGVYVVGVHHYGSGRLAIDAGYHVVPEPHNRYDPKAIAVKDGERIVGHLSRATAHALFSVISNYARSSVMLRIKEAPEVRSQRQGPRQKGNLGFKVDECEYETVVEQIHRNGLTVSN